MSHDHEAEAKRSPRAVPAVTDGPARQRENAQDGYTIARDAKEAEVVADDR